MCVEGAVESAVFDPVHELIRRLTVSYGEESPKDWRDPNAGNVFFVLVHSSVDGGNPFTDHHHLRPLVGRDDNGIVVRIQREKFNLFVLLAVLGDGLGRVILFHRKSS